METLFLRINIQYKTNLRYKARHGARSTQKSAARKGHGLIRDQSARGSSVNDPIDLESAHSQAELARNGENGSKGGFPSAESSSRHAAPMETRSGGHQQETQETDPWEVPKTPDLPVRKTPGELRLTGVLPITDMHRQGQSSATQGSHAGKRTAQPTSASTRDATLGVKPAATSGTKRATTEAARHSPKRPRVNITIHRASNYEPERTPQRKSSRKRSCIYDSLDFTGEAHSPTETAHPPEAAAQTVAEKATPSKVAQDVREMEQEASQGYVPATAPLNAAVPGAFHAPNPVPVAAQPVPLPERAPTPPKVTRSGEERTLPADLEGEVEPALASQGKAPEAPAETPAPHPDANAGISAIDAFLFSRVNALSTSGTPEERSAQLFEHLRHGARVPEAPMGLVHDPGLQFLAARRQTSPPPPEMGEHEWDETTNVPFNSTESTKKTTEAAEAVEAMKATEAAETAAAATIPNCTGTAHISTMSPEVASSRVTPERSTTQPRTENSLAAKSPAASAPEKQESTARESEKSSAAPPLLPAHSELRLFVTGPRLHEEWKGAPSLSDLTIARIKSEIPLQLSPEFRGFKFTLRGPGRRHRFEILDGDEQAFVHLQLDVEEVMEDMEEQDQGKSVYLGFQLRIEELRDIGVKEDQTNS